MKTRLTEERVRRAQRAAMGFRAKWSDVVNLAADWLDQHARIAELEGLPLRCGETDEDIPLREWRRCSLTDGETWLYQCPVCGEYLAPVGP